MKELIPWLMTGDPSIQYQVARDLLCLDYVELEAYRNRIHLSGWCQKLIELWDSETKMWGQGVYTPKWTSTTYTMLDLKNFEVKPNLKCFQESAKLLLRELKVDRRPIKETPLDLCICGMLLNLSCYAGLNVSHLKEIVDVILNYHLMDGGWNCKLKHTHHSSLHTTINILEGFLEYERGDYSYRIDEIREAVNGAHEFILNHRLYRSDKTNEVIKQSFTMLSYPSRWKYDILRCLDYFRKAGVSYDVRMDDALSLLKKKQKKDGTWPVQQKYTGTVHFDYEKIGEPSRINTLRALRVLKKYDK